ncbi:two pore domain potassium channel family protein [Candidatus Peregrinibacteria bacterium]|nr:two pore domain potassium channel family protein [Candidatus Peregrinibacteria bacterium]
MRSKLLRKYKNRSKKPWRQIEKKFKYYELVCSPANWGKNKFYVGQYLIIRFILLSLFFAFISNKNTLCNYLLLFLTTYLLFDLMVSNISTSFITMSPLNKLRSFVLTFFAFIQIILSFGIYYKFLQDKFNYVMCNSQIIYFSAVTITTLGFGDFRPNETETSAQIVVIVEVLTGLIFITGVFARILNFKNK